MFSLPKFRLDQYFSLLLVLLILFTFPLVTHSKAQTPVKERKIDLIKMAPLPVFSSDASMQQKPTIFASHALAIDVVSASILFEKNSNDFALPASTTKLMTSLVAKDIFDLDDVLIIDKADLINGNSVGFKVEEEITIRSLIFALLMNSSNDAAHILANNYDGGFNGFVELMNKKAQELGLTKTVFENPSGFDGENQISSARDLGVLAREVMKDELLKQVVSTKKQQIFDTSENITHWLYNTNELLHTDQDVVGVKTGTTDGAGQVLITQVEKNGQEVLIVVMDSEDRYADTKKIKDWVFSSYKWVTLELKDLVD